MHRPGRIESLTGLRFVAAFVVALEHFYQVIPGATEDAMMQGGAGVSLFFVLSGFVLVLNYGDRFAAPERRRVLATYARARVARIVPLHLVALAVVAVLIFWRADPLGSHGLGVVLVSLLANALLLHAWIPAQVLDLWNGPAWSISVELFFYACLPLLVPLVVWPLLRRRWLGRAIVAIGIVEIVLFILLSWAVAEVLISRNGDLEATRLIVVRLARFPPLRLGEFVIGALLGAGFRPESRQAARGGWALLEQRRWRTGALIGAMCLGAAIQFTPPTLGGRTGGVATTTWSMIDLRLFAVYLPVVVTIVAAVAWGDSVFARWLRHPLLVRLGEASYAFYILQWIAWLVINDRAVGPPGPLLAGGAIVATLVASLLAHDLIERPARQWVLGRRDADRSTEVGSGTQ